MSDQSLNEIEKYAKPHKSYKSVLNILNNMNDTTYIFTGSDWKMRRMIHILAESKNLYSAKYYVPDILNFCTCDNTYYCSICEHYYWRKKDKPLTMKDLCIGCIEKVGKENIKFKPLWVKISNTVFKGSVSRKRSKNYTDI